MFDTPNPIEPAKNAAATVAPDAGWADDLRPGAVVLFAFPVREPGDGDKPKLRPCLVMHVAKIDGERFVTLAYGTTSDSRANRGHEIAVTGPAEVAAAGLDRATRFVGARLITVIARHVGFRSLAISCSPVLGALTGGAAARHRAVLNAFAAQSAARRVRLRRRKGAPSFTVERRRLGDAPNRRAPRGRG